MPVGKKCYYFSHDSNARTDPKMKDMITDYKAQGYGAFWAIIESMSEQDGYRLACAKQSYRSIAMDVLWDSDSVAKFVLDCIQEFKLFETDGDYFWSESLRRRMMQRDELIDKRKSAGKEGADKRWGKQIDSKPMAELSQPHSTPIAPDSKLNEIKGKEIKGNEKEGNDLSNDKSRAIFKPPSVEEVAAYCRERCNAVVAQQWHDFYSSKGWMIGKNKMKDWKAAVRTWEKGGNTADSFRRYE
jgi:hypothetical protein